MVIAAIDFGKRRIGLAAADPSGIVVYPVATINRSSLRRDLEALKVRLNELEVTRIIAGLPLNMDGSIGASARAAETFARHLEAATGIPVEMHDERLTSFEARERLAGMNRRGGRGAVDAVAAVVILESWLSKRRVSKP